MRTVTTRRARVLTATAVSALTLTALVACGSETDEPGESSGGVTVSDTWVKAVTDEEMTAAFGVLTNESDTDLTLVSASTPVAGMVELHEVVMKDGSMVMQPKEGGIPIPAGEDATLEPGGDHIMLMELSGPIEPGDVVELELEFNDGSSLTVDATAKEFSGADENYDGGDSMGEE